MANAMLLIHPYKDRGTWVFDDEGYGLVREPFVMGASQMIDELVKDLPGAQKGFRLTFSGNQFPGYQKEVQRVREEYGGNWYRDPQTGTEGWLCPALFQYFK